MLLVFGVPLVAIALFLWLWSVSAARVQTSLGTVPGPVQVLAQAKGLLDDHLAERAKQAEFYQRQEERNRQRLAEDPQAKVTVHKWTGKPTFVDQILTSLKTVFTGFLIATLVAVPLGILCGSSRVDPGGAQSDDPGVPAGLAARLAADRHADRERGLRDDATARCSRSPSSCRRSR